MVASRKHVGAEQAALLVLLLLPQAFCSGDDGACVGLLSAAAVRAAAGEGVAVHAFTSMSI